MEILYKCRCMKEERKLIVTDRVPKRDLGEWMHVLETSISYAHRSCFPNCHSQKMEYVKIPVTGSDELGVPTTKQ